MTGKPNQTPYEVGYGRPPSQSRFKPGQSGNPKGRPRGARDFGKLLDLTLSQKIIVTEGGGSRELSKGEALILSLTAKAIKGDARAVAQVIRLMESHRDQINTPDTKGLTINVIDSFDNSK